MMQPWNRSSECIFCLYRGLTRPTTCTTSSRSFHATAVVARSRPNERARDKDRDRSRGKLSQRSRNESHAEMYPGSSNRAVHRPLINTITSVSEDLTMQRRVTNAIKTTKRMLKTPLEDINPSARYLKKIDPDGKAWESFEEMVNDIIKHRQSGLGRPKKFGLIDRLQKAASSADWAQEVDRELRFAFLDHVLSRGESTISDILPEADLRYPTEWYGKARQIQRDIHLHVGPTNSGKTYNALKRLEEAQNGFYAGPLRLLAHEVYSRFNGRNIKCDLVTGDDVRLNDSTQVQLYASTVEMVNIGREQEVGVIDEIQMMGSEDRGWAWTRAVLGAQVRELHLCGETRVVPLIRELVASMGDTLHIHQYDRLNPLKVMSRSLKGNLNNLRRGDCVVSFSIVGIHALKRQIELDTGKRVAIVYGSLPPETRAHQAALFNDPDNDYDFLVASDAIGMGLNLSIKRVVFETTMKYNGSFSERLSISQLKQIAGRAGRFRTAQDDKAATAYKSGVNQYKTTASVGLVTCLDEADLPYIQKALGSEAMPLKSAGVLPPGEVYEEFYNRLPAGTPFEYVMQRVHESASLNPRFSLCNTDDQIGVARLLDRVPDLSLRDRIVFCAAPTSIRGSQRQDQIVIALARAVAEHRGVTVADIPEIPLENLDQKPSPQRGYLESLESLHKALILFLWLSYRFQTIFRDQDMATRAKQLAEDKINEALLNFSANPKLRERLLHMKESSARLREQTKGNVVGMSATINPDATVEEVEQQAQNAEHEQTDAHDEGETEKVSGVDGLKDQTALSFDWGTPAGEPHMQPAEEQVIDEVQKEAAGASRS